MTSPAINGQKENGKSESTSTAAAEESTSRQQPNPDTVRSHSPLTAWWRVFKLANLLMQQGC